MKLRRWKWMDRTAKKLTRPLSKLAVSRLFFTPLRMLDAYFNILVGKGSGTGWALEDEIHAALSLTYRPQPVIFDVGANVGKWSSRLLAADPSATLFLFEPSPFCREKIAARPELCHVTVTPAAVGEKAGKALLHFSQPTDGSASLHAREDSFFEDRTYSQIEVDVVTIDDFIASHQLEFIDFLKMDIEGHELFALQGAKKALAERRIGALLFEFGSGNINSQTFFRQFWKLLTAAGFRIWRITPGGKPIEIDEYYEDLEYFRGVSNYVAQLKDHPYAPAHRGNVSQS
jgi:FkbM family methyltransferase